MLQFTPSRPAARPTPAARLADRMRAFELRLADQPVREAEAARARAAATAALDAWRRCLGDENERAALWRGGVLPALHALWRAEDAARL